MVTYFYSKYGKLCLFYSILKTIAGWPERSKLNVYIMLVFNYMLDILIMSENILVSSEISFTSLYL